MTATKEVDSPHRLIASDRVQGTPVYDRDGERLGTVKNFMVDKVSGKAEYAIMEFGGFLGIGESRHPLPWDTLTYDPDQSGYVVDLDKDTLKDAPHYMQDNEPAFDAEYGRRVYDYYGVAYM